MTRLSHARVRPGAPLRRRGVALAVGAALCALAAPARAEVPADTFKLRVSGRVQTLFEHDSRDPQTRDKRVGAVPGTVDEVGDAAVLRVRRARLIFDGFAYTPRLEYSVQIEAGGEKVLLKRAYFNLQVRGEAVQLRAGRFKVPVGRQLLTSIFSQQAVDRSLVSDAFTSGDDDGAMVWGLPAAGRMEYYLGVFDAGAATDGPGDGVPQVAGRVAWSPLGRVPYTGSALDGSHRLTFSLGADAAVDHGWTRDVNGVPGLQVPTVTCGVSGCAHDRGDDARVLTTGVDAIARWHGVSASGEWFHRVADPRQEGLPDVRAAGWYAQAGAFAVPSRLEAGVRVGALDPAAGVAMDRVRELTPFATWFVRGNGLKVQADYTRLRTEVPDARVGGQRAAWVQDGRARVQLQISFR